MNFLTLCLSLCLFLGSPYVVEPRTTSKTASLDEYRLPEGFLFGAGWSAYQVEGAWDADGKGINVFDHGYHRMNVTAGDVAADFYHRYKEDIDIAAKLGLNALRISLSWARIFPTGRDNNVNEQGVQFYHSVLDYMISKNIKPIVTIFHFDYPQTLEEEFGGWLSIKMSDVFAQLSDFVFQEYGSKVRYWLTVNEAGIYCNVAGGIPPFTITGEKTAICLHNMLLAHATAHKIYEEKYKSKYKGIVGFGVGPYFSRPATDSDEDKTLADRENLAQDYSIGLSLDALVFGDYPEMARTTRPSFTEEEKNLIRGRIDWVGVNMYTGLIQNASETTTQLPSKALEVRSPSFDFRVLFPYQMASAWTLREVPRWIRSRYGDLPVFFTENGVSTEDTADDWDRRAVYCSAYLRELLDGINKDGNKVFGYTMWALTDTFEWTSHYFERWGMVYVDFEGGSLNRTLKTSAPFFKRLTRTWTVPLVLEDTEPFIEDLGDQTSAPSTQRPGVPSKASSANISALLAVVVPVAWTLLRSFGRTD